MNKRHIKFPSIDQFPTIVTNINRHFNFVGLDENGDAIYDKTLQKPKLKFKGRVKLHGTNGSVCHNEPSGMWTQSRERIITTESDNAGFAFFTQTKEEILTNLFEQVREKNNVDLNSNTISIYGEWCGSNIQSTVGLTNLEKSFFIFGVKISPFDENEVAYWVDHSYLRSPENKIYNIDDYETFEIEIDFNVPQLSQNKLNELALQVEAECPVAKAFLLDVCNDNTAYEDEKGNIWFDKENNYTLSIKEQLIPIFKEKREEHTTGVNFIKFNMK